MKMVFIAHPVGGDIQDNLMRAAQWMKWAYEEKHVLPLAPYIGICKVLDDDDPRDRILGRHWSMQYVQRCDQLWLCGDRISPGMKAEGEQALGLGIPAYRFIEPNETPIRVCRCWFPNETPPTKVCAHVGFKPHGD